MRKNRKGMMRERIILMGASAFVLAALTMTGIYMRKSNLTKEEDYIAKLQSVEESTLEALDQAAKGNLGSMTDQNSFNALFENDMDYSPLEEGEISVTGSGTVELGKNKDTKVTDEQKEEESPVVDTVGEAQRVSGEPGLHEGVLDEEGILVETVIDEQPLSGEGIAESELLGEETGAIQEIPQKELTFNEELIRPVSGTVLIPYNMSGSVYFKTLDHYSYNPAQIISAEQGADVVACADGRVKEISRDAKLGEMLVLDLGSGYEAVYGQLCDIAVSVGDLVSAGQKIAKVQKPTYFYSAEGSNLYFELKAGGDSLNPEAYY